MKHIGAALILLGTILLLGTAGSSDQGIITFEQTIVRGLIGLAMLGAGTVIIRIANELKRIKRKKGIKA